MLINRIWSVGIFVDCPQQIKKIKKIKNMTGLEQVSKKFKFAGWQMNESKTRFKGLLSAEQKANKKWQCLIIENEV
jgi:hypothetical protein